MFSEEEKDLNSTVLVNMNIGRAIPSNLAIYKGISFVRCGK
jgi:hypothetical protein